MKEKHAFLITAYKNPDQLRELVDSLDSDRSFFFIHLDKRSQIDNSIEFEHLRLKENVSIVKQFAVRWGGFCHTKAILLLAQLALQKGNFAYLHTLTGQCFPIVSKIKFFDFFEVNKGKEYIDFFDVPKLGWDTDGGMERINIFHFNDHLDIKNNKQIYWYNRLLTVQKKLGIKRKYNVNFPKLYAGSTWWSLTAGCVSHILLFLQKTPGFYNRFKNTFCSEEFIFQTIIMSSPFKEKVQNDTLRYIDWNNRNGNYPANLDETDFVHLIKSKNLIARKFEIGISDELKRLITENISISEQR